MDLSTTYLGLKLRSPLMPSACPLTRDLDSVVQSAVWRRDGRIVAEVLDGQYVHLTVGTRDGQWRTLFSIAERTGHPEASVSARLRDLRKSKHGGYTVERQYIANGTYRYRLVV